MNLTNLFESCVVKHDRLVKKWCEPLESALGVGYFSYQRVETSGRYQFFANSPEYVQFYVENRLYELDNFLVHPRHYDRDFYVFFSRYCDEERDFLKTLRRKTNKFGFNQSLLLVNKQEKAFEFYCFALQSKRREDLNQCLNEIDTLKDFSKFFKGNIQSLSHLEEEFVQMDELRGDRFHTGQDCPALDMKGASVKSLRQKVCTDPDRPFVLEAVSLLSPRERECLRWSFLGKTASEIGIILQISHRTVEQHLISGRTKFRDFASNQAQLAYVLGKCGIEL